jgi:hypothetical protein
VTAGLNDRRHQSMFGHFLNAYTSRKFVSGVNCCHQKLASTFGGFCSSFLKFKTKLYTDTLLSQVGHHKTTNSQKQNNGNMFTNNKPNHSARRRLPH